MSTNSSPSFRLLIVDDIADNREILTRIFAKRGYAIDEAASGESALALIRNSNFDAVLLDVVMPGMSGFDVLTIIRQTHTRSTLPVIMVTALAETRDIARGLQLGANDYITKPVDFSIAIARVESQLERVSAERALAQRLEELQSVNRRLEYEVAERQKSEAALHHMAYHDFLTGLANRRHFRDVISGRISDGSAGPASLFFLDLDHFKLINDTLGHQAGDLLLQRVAERLRQVTAPSDLVARLSGDEFAIFRHQDASEVASFAAQVMEAITGAYDLAGHQARVTSSLGIALAPEHGSTCDQLLASADLALYRAKAEGRGRYQMFQIEMNERAQARLMLEADIVRGLEHGQFELHYQPQLTLGSQSITGFEALIRWRHPDRGFIPPLDFIPVAEETTLIVTLGRWVLFEACREAARWPMPVKVAVNCSAKQFIMGAPFKDVSEALRISELAPERLELEITESLLLENDERTIEELHKLRRLGVRISMDDFGTGYSSLKYLRTFPFDKIKLDRSFVRDLPSAKESAAIVRAVLGLANNLGMATTGEGVETVEQLAFLGSLGCTEVQGYLISPPVEAKQIPLLLSQTMPVERRVA